MKQSGIVCCKLENTLVSIYIISFSKTCKLLLAAVKSHVNSLFKYNLLRKIQNLNIDKKFQIRSYIF